MLRMMKRPGLTCEHMAGLLKGRPSGLNAEALRGGDGARKRIPCTRRPDHGAKEPWQEQADSSAKADARAGRYRESFLRR